MTAGPAAWPASFRGLSEYSLYRWRHLSTETLHSRSRRFCSRSNSGLAAAAEQESGSPLAPIFRLWAADNLAWDGELAAAITAYDDVVAAGDGVPAFIEGVDTVAGALYHKAQAAARTGQERIAQEAYRALHEIDPADPDPMFQAGLVTEWAGDPAGAAQFYRLAATGAPSIRTDDSAELARRALLRLDEPESAFQRDARGVADTLAAALERRDVALLSAMVTRTHFAAGPGGGHTQFEAPELLDDLWCDLNSSRVHARRRLVGSGEKLYLHTRGWRGRRFRGEVVLMITRCPRGWQWTGLGILAATEAWLDHWTPNARATNQPLPFGLAAPWPAGQNFMAGGLGEFAAHQALILAAGWPLGPIAAFALSARDCGFGPRGYYYNQGPTHDSNDAFAVDFTRFQRFAPYVNASGGTAVLAARAGIVAEVRAGIPTGSASAANKVEIFHADPALPSDIKRFRSRYLHLEGPFKIPVSSGMEVMEGRRVGLMDDTGNSVLDHLHFSVQRNLGTDGSPNWASVRPSPLAGVRLDDSASGTCIASSTIEATEPPPVSIITHFTEKYWVVTPVAAPAGTAAPARIEDQRWLVVLTGVAVVDFKGVATSWRRQTLSLWPDLATPLDWAINRYRIPRPANPDNTEPALAVEQWAPFATLGSVYDHNQSINAGFAVDGWRPDAFHSGTDATTKEIHQNLFTGLQVDVAVSDTDAIIHRLGYQLTMIGRIVFTRHRLVE